MAQATAIGWTDKSWNPVHGCSIVSTECRHCYAATLSLRYGQTRLPWTPENAAENVTLKPHKLREPLSAGKDWRGVGDAARAAGKKDGMLVFVNSMSDLFHERVPAEFVADVFATMVLADRHTFQVLTKRPEVMHALLSDVRFWWTVADKLRERGAECEARAVEHAAREGGDVWLKNVWLGVSVGLRQFVGRLDYLRATPAAVRFVSAEPLLGPLVGPHRLKGGQTIASVMRGEAPAPWSVSLFDDGRRGVDLRGVDWVIVGGESGPEHRPMALEWVRDLLSEAACPSCAGTGWLCAATGRPATGACCGTSSCPSSEGCPACHVPGECGGRGRRAAFFMKQLGGARPGTPMELLPEDLRLREFPAVAS